MSTERKNITQPADWWHAFERAAQRRGLTLSQWIGETCAAALSVTEQRKLSHRPSQGRPLGYSPKGDNE